MQSRAFESVDGSLRVPLAWTGLSGLWHAQRQPPRAWNPLTLGALAAAWMAGLANGPLWHALLSLPEMSSGRGAVFVLGFFTVIWATLTALLAGFAWARSVKPALSLCLLVAAGGAHFMGAYGIVIDPGMVANVLQTDVAEVRDLLGLRLAATVLLLAGLPVAWLWRQPVRRLPLARQSRANLVAMLGGLLVALAVVLLLFGDVAATMRNHKTLRYMVNPWNSFYAIGVASARVGAKPAGPPLPLGLDAYRVARPLGSKPPLLLLVVGETARADHFALNGYARPTNPSLSGRGVVSFSDVTSCGTHTAASVPCMFSAAGRDGFDASGPAQESLLDVLHRAGLAVLWIDNQSGCKGVCDRIPHARAGGPMPDALPPSATPPCSPDGCPDEVLLQGLDARLASLPAERRAGGVVIVLHQMGSHGPAYAQRSPAGRKPFAPECATNVLKDCSHEQLINAYDNSIAYTDHVLGRALDWLGQKSAVSDPMLLYVSDHGESLGEKGLYLHGMPYRLAPREQTHVPLVMWWPSQSDAGLGASLSCLRGRSAVALSHDHLFHTVLGMAGVWAHEYQPRLDILAPCRAL